MYSIKCPQRNWLKSLDMSLLAMGEACNQIFQWHSMARPGQFFQWRNDFLAQSSTALQTNAISICSVYYVQSLCFFSPSFIHFIHLPRNDEMNFAKSFPQTQQEVALQPTKLLTKLLQFIKAILSGRSPTLCPTQWRKKKKSGSRWEIATVAYGLYIWMDKMGEGQEHRLC